MSNTFKKVSGTIEIVSNKPEKKMVGVKVGGVWYNAYKTIKTKEGEIFPNPSLKSLIKGNSVTLNVSTSDDGFSKIVSVVVDGAASQSSGGKASNSGDPKSFALSYATRLVECKAIELIDLPRYYKMYLVCLTTGSLVLPSEDGETCNANDRALGNEEIPEEVQGESDPLF